MVDVKTRVDNFQKFYAMENERILFGFFHSSEYPLFRYETARNLPENKALTPEDFIVDDYLSDYERLYREHEECGGDCIYSASAYWGIPWLEAIMGCSIYADHKAGSIYSKPPDKIEIPEFSENNPWVIKMGEFLTKLIKHSNGRYPLAVTRMRGISDLLSALFGGDFVYEMIDNIDNPDEIKKLTYPLTKLFIDVCNYQLDKIPDFYSGIGSFYYHNWVPKGTIWYQEDANALLSPNLYNEFIRPCSEEIIKAFNGVILHQHPTGFVPDESYIKMGLLAMELHIDSGGQSAEQLYERHLRILKEKPLIIWGDLSDTDLDWIFSKLPYRGLCVVSTVKDKYDALQLFNKFSV